MIELVNVRRTYGEKVAVADLSLTIQPGEVFAYLGPNGAGKTTTIKMLVGLLQPTHGIIRIAGYDVVQQTRQAHRLTGYVPTFPISIKVDGARIPDICWGMHGLDRATLKQSASNRLENLSCKNSLMKLAENYSHGMRQRVAFAAALLHDPAVVYCR